MRSPKPVPPPPRFDTTPGKPLSRGARIAISAFIVFHLFGILTWCVPSDTPLTVSLRSIAAPYVLWAGLFQKWDMFSPDPPKLNGYVTAEITYADGHTSVWSFPRMDQLGLFDKYTKERYRKFANENLRLDAFAPLWPDAARYIARLNKGQPSNPPVSVALVRHWSFVQPPSRDGSPENGPWNHFKFFQYPVKPGDLL